MIQHTCHCTRSISHMTAAFYPLVIRYHPPKVPSRAEQMGLWADDGALRGMAGTAEDTTAMATGTANGRQAGTRQPRNMLLVTPRTNHPAGCHGIAASYGTIDT
ncbi:hypothetical protein BBJK_03194 [Bifidobacterium bifidum LMG 13195]|uniref:Uncharacterized protein n=1 Tax=Bifidobacterium bifidum LMG 13195 TaxID=1207542 RepID=A0A286TFV8_BIFBI|nr:hypothetical protein BBJK_03194 [Bifidobacterium bifidum LMG 13195]